MIFLFKVEETFQITGRGLILTPGLGKNHARVGNKIRLILPDKSFIDTKIMGVEFGNGFPILVGSELKKGDVPADTEVWLYE